LGATETWTADSGNWSTAANWNDGAGPVPGNADTVDITNDDTSNRVISYDYTGPSVTPEYVTVDNDGGGDSTLSMAGSGTALTAQYVNVGYSASSTLAGSGILVQSVGAATLSGLDLGGNAGDRRAYSLSASGTLSISLGETRGENIGVNGTGIFTQSGGKNDPGFLTLGFESGSAGTYSLSGTGQVTSSTEYIGDSGAGAFTQSGGSNSTSNFYLAYYGGSGNYILSAGSLTVSTSEEIGSDGAATFTQTGGKNTAEDLYVGTLNSTNSSYSLGGSGILTITGAGERIWGQFYQSGGTNNAGFLVLGSPITTPSYTYALSGGTVTADATSIYGSQFNQTGGTASLGTLEGTGTLSVGNAIGGKCGDNDHRPIAAIFAEHSANGFCAAYRRRKVQCREFTDHCRRRNAGSGGYAAVNQLWKQFRSDFRDRQLYCRRL
jgi:hypothetical protein